MSPIAERHFRAAWDGRGWTMPLPAMGGRIRITKRETASFASFQPGDECYIERVWLAEDEVCVEVCAWTPAGKTVDTLWAGFGDRWEVA